MTDEYKIETLNYLLGNITPTASDNSEIFLEQEEMDRNDWLPFIPNSWSNFRYEGMVAPNEMTSGLTVLYGGYLDTSGNSHGIITLVDENFKPVKTIYKRDAGVELRYIQYMKQAEDGTFYYIDDAVMSPSQTEKSSTADKRLIMTNNFTIKDTTTNDYVLSYRKYYYFDNAYKNFYCKNMYKDPDTANYIFFGSGASKNTSTGIWDWRNLRIIGLKINVGQPNEWTSYVNETERLFGSAMAIFENGNPKFRCVSGVLSTANRTIDMTSNYGGSINTFAIATFSYSPYVDENQQKKQSVFVDTDTVYFVQNNQHWGVTGTAAPKHIGLYKYVVSTGTLTEIYHKSLGNYDRCNLEAIYIDRCNTDLYVQYNNNINGVTYTADYYFQRLVNDTWQPILIGTQKNFIYHQRSLYVKANFNLLQCYIYAINPRQPSWFQYLIKEDYNSSNYNGTPYIDYNSLISQKGQIYSNNKLVFARNLYNRTQNGGTTVSTIQIPNNYLNGIQLDLKKLISQTNLDINRDTNITDKNIYEMVFVNYINTLQVIDEDTGTLYPRGAEAINTNINIGTSANCNNTLLGKIRINYSTPVVEQITWQKIDDTHYQTNFSVDTNNEIPTSVDFISSDETITYMTKELDLEEDKTYVVSQKIRIE